MNRTTALDLEADMARVAAAMRVRASMTTFTGRGSEQALLRFMAAHRVEHAPTRTVLIFTRDVGYHSSGWWKNPLFERCFHLSIAPAPSPIVFARPQVVDLDTNLQAQWVRAFFGADCDKLWAEPPYSTAGKAHSVWHHRLFCDPAWQPILPTGEVYSRELTEKGWLSSSEVQPR